MKMQVEIKFNDDRTGRWEDLGSMLESTADAFYGFPQSAPVAVNDFDFIRDADGNIVGSWKVVAV